MHTQSLKCNILSKCLHHSMMLLHFALTGLNQMWSNIKKYNFENWNNYFAKIYIKLKLQYPYLKVNRIKYIHLIHYVIQWNQYTKGYSTMAWTPLFRNITILWTSPQLLQILCMTSCTIEWNSKHLYKYIHIYIQLWWDKLHLKL